MSIRKIRFWSLLGSLGACGVAATLVVWATTAPPEQFFDASDSLPVEVPTDSIATPPLLAREELASLSARKYQAPLFDPPPPPAPPPPPPKPKPTLTVKLMATMIDPTGNQAMFSDAKGAIRIVNIGDHVAATEGTAEVLEIDSNRVVVKLQEDLVTLQLSSNL